MRELSLKQIKDYLKDTLVLGRIAKEEITFFSNLVNTLKVTEITEELLISYISADVMMYAEPDKTTCTVYQFEDGRKYNIYLPAGGNGASLLISKLP